MEKCDKNRFITKPNDGEPKTVHITDTKTGEICEKYDAELWEKATIDGEDS